MLARSRLFTLLVMAGLPLQPVVGVHALEMVPVLPTALAAQAALKALDTCRSDGYAVAVTVVNQEGNVIAALRSERSGSHTLEHSFNKAFTVVSLGRTYGLDSTSDIAKRFEGGKAPGIGSFPLAASPLKGLSYSTGGLVIKARGVVVGAIGVSGAPDGNVDQGCAARGLQLIQPQLR